MCFIGTTRQPVHGVFTLNRIGQPVALAAGENLAAIQHGHMPSIASRRVKNHVLKPRQAPLTSPHCPAAFQNFLRCPADVFLDLPCHVSAIECVKKRSPLFFGPAATSLSREHRHIRALVAFEESVLKFSEVKTAFGRIRHVPDCLHFGIFQPMNVLPCAVTLVRQSPHWVTREDFYQNFLNNFHGLVNPVRRGHAQPARR